MSNACRNKWREEALYLLNLPGNFSKFDFDIDLLGNVFTEIMMHVHKYHNQGKLQEAARWKSLADRVLKMQ